MLYMHHHQAGIISQNTTITGSSSFCAMTAKNNDYRPSTSQGQHPLKEKPIQELENRLPLS
jgi:hypothetical protein